MKYESPKIVELGSMADLTAGSKSNGSESTVVEINIAGQKSSRTNTINAHA